MNDLPNVIEIDGTSYLKRNENANDKFEPNYYCVRTYSAGVFFGYLASRDGKEVTLTNARRIWRWDGAATLSELAMRGTSSPNECKFPIEVDEVILTEVIEMIKVTKEAKATIDAVPVWSAHID